MTYQYQATTKEVQKTHKLIDALRAKVRKRLMKKGAKEVRCRSNIQGYEYSSMSTDEITFAPLDQDELLDHDTIDLICNGFVNNLPGVRKSNGEYRKNSSVDMKWDLVNDEIDVVVC